MYSDLDGDLEPGEPDSREMLTRYSTEIPATDFGPARDQIHVEITRKTREPMRVLPHTRAAVPDLPPVLGSLDLKPIMPIHFEPEIVLIDIYFWVVFLGRRVGIFRARA